MSRPRTTDQWTVRKPKPFIFHICIDSEFTNRHPKYQQYHHYFSLSTQFPSLSFTLLIFSSNSLATFKSILFSFPTFLGSSVRRRTIILSSYPLQYRLNKNQTCWGSHNQGFSMANSGGIESILRNWGLENCFENDSRSNSQISVMTIEEVMKQRIMASKGYADDGLVCVLISWIRIVACFMTMMVTTFVWAIIMILLIPWPYERIRQGNIYGHVTGRLLMWILGNPIKIEGVENSNKRAIYICNHASPIDIFLIMWLTPTGTVGVAKKEIIWYPLFGQLYVLANHLRIDRSNPAAAIKSMQEVAHAVIKNSLSLIIFPEGTRSKSGRLLPFKKGFVHFALQTRLPIIPIVMTGTHNAWRKDSLHVRPAPITVKYLPPIKTDNWTEDKISEYVSMVHDVYVKHLPESQKPLLTDSKSDGLTS